MQFTTLGSSGLRVSRICFGCMSIGERSPFFPWLVDEEESRKLIRTALENGVNFFDTANAYGLGSSEEFLGRALKQMAVRDEVVVATKVFFGVSPGPNTNGLSRKVILQEVENSLRRLGTDYIDLYQIHRWDDDTPIEETMEALHDLIKAGKVRYIGASSMSAWQFQKAQFVAERNGWTKFISMQNQLSLLYREEEREMLPLCADQGVGVIPWSPLARGRLTRDWGEESERSKGDHFAREFYSGMGEAAGAFVMESDRKIVAEVARIAEEREVPRAQIGLAWLHARHEVAAPIVGVAREQHLIDAVASLELQLEEKELERLEANYVPHGVVLTGKAATRDRSRFQVTVR